MKQMRKILSLVLLTAMLLSLGTTAFAAAPEFEEPEEESFGSSWGDWEDWENTDPDPEPAPAEDAAAEEAAEPVAEPVEEEIPAEEAVEEEVPVEVAYPANTFFYVGGSGLRVTVEAPEGAFPIDAEISVTEVRELQHVQDLIDASNFAGQTAVVAADISFADAEGNDLQPMLPVKVSLKDSSLAGVSNPVVLHIDDDGELSEVPQYVDGVLQPVSSLGVSNSASFYSASDVASTQMLSFEAESFSTYVITWENASEEEESATVHFGELKDGAFTEFDETKLVALDTSASTVSLNVNFPGYSFSSAEYKASASADPVEIDSILYKDSAGAWQVNAHIGEAAQRVNIADGSDIYVYYAVPTSPNPQSGDDVEGPTTEKTVTDNGDGTFTIRLDTVGAIHEDVQQTGANVLIVLDTTYSMASSMTGAANRFEAARSAILTLIDTLDCGTNDIELALVEFNSVGSIKYNWTKDYTTFRSYIADTAQHATGPTGTNWESGLYYARQVLNSKDGDATYVIFLTDGEPNRRGTTTSTNAGTSTAISYALTQAQAITGTANTSLYGVFCGSASGYDNLNNMINNAGGVETINGTDADGIKSAFEGIASTIVSNLGASGVSVDDGIPSLSSVSASVTGEAGGFQYYITPKDGTEQTWTDAPGATYSQENGVTWDLSSVGVLQDGYTYSLEFTVWPSQAAYDLIADLNNGKVKYEDLDQATKDSITGSKETGYTMKTNTHLQTTYTYNGTTYTDPFDASAKAMDLPTETITVEKLWHNYLDGRTDEDIDGLQLVLSRDGNEYLEFDVSAATSWKKDNIYISCGQIVNGEVKETGHDYFVTEKAAETVDKTAYWEVDSPVYHPMVINGTATMLILDEEATAAVEGTTYKIGDKYCTVDSSSTTMTAVNERVSWLNLIKTVTGEEADPNQLFTFSVTINEPTAGEDIFFSVFGGGVSYRDDVETSATKWVEEGTNRTYYVAKSGEAFTVSVKADWSTRFLNLPTGTTYSITEQDLPEGFVLDSSKSVETFYVASKTPAEGFPKTTDFNAMTVTGTVNQTNTDYTVTFTNEFLGYFYVYHSGVAGGNLETILITPEVLEGYNLLATPEGQTYNTLYGGYYLEGNFTAPAVDEESGKPTVDCAAYDGDNWTWTKGETTSALSIVPVAGTTYYLKEVPADKFLQPYTHYTYYKADNVISNIWEISDIDDLNYKETGFIFLDKDNIATVCKTLTVKNAVGGASVKLMPTNIYRSKGATASDYLAYLEVTKSGVEGQAILQYWVTPDNLIVTGSTQRTLKDIGSKTTITKTDVADYDTYYSVAVFDGE